jgi:hypothetical protein
MSIATLKRKTQTQYNNMSVNSKYGFSLNGTRRSQGYIGRGVLGLHFPKTPMRGNEPRGSGGCCGTYRRGPIVYDNFCFPSNDGMSANNDPSVVKKSVLDTNGQLMTQYRWIRRPAPYAVVKPDSNMIQNTQQNYIENLSKKTIANLSTNDLGSVCKPFANSCGGLTKDQRPRPFNTVIRIPRGWYSITKTANNSPSLGPISQGEFIKALGGLCTNNDVLPRTSTNNAVLPGPSASF